MNLHTIATTIALACIAITACGDPCLPTINADTLIIPPADDCKADTSGDVSSSGASSSGGACEPPPVQADAPTCASVPQPGNLWGPCIEGACNEGFCRETGMGSLCMATCDGCGCEVFDCFGGTCLDDGECAPHCDVATAQCPAPGMLCDTDAQLCVYPSAPTCMVPAGEAYGPCGPGWTCADGLACNISDDAKSSMCVPGDCTNVWCNNGPCQTNTPTCQTSSLCAYVCDDVSDCIDGQVCAKNGAKSFCQWPQQ